MRIGILGASGRVGTTLVEAVLASPGMDLVAALVSPGSPYVGQRVAGGLLEYRPPDYYMRCYCDVIIDFSTPTSSLVFQELLRELPIPVVIGTTGFSTEQEKALAGYASRRPLLIDTNFAPGFQIFKKVALEFAKRIPGAPPQVFELHRSRKTLGPTAASTALASELDAVRSRAMGFEAEHTTVHARREPDFVGLSEVRFDLGAGEVNFSFKVRAPASYAEGAIAAAQWLANEAPGPGLYSIANSLPLVED